MPQVSIIIPTFNRSQQVARAVRSVLQQDFRDFEIMVIDDGSTDTTAVALNDYFPLIRYLRQPVNRGVSAARNRGIQSSASPWIAFLDSDDFWLKHKLRVQMAFLERHPAAVACQTQEVWIRRGRRVNPRRKHKKPTGDIFEQSLKLCLVSPSSAIVKRVVFDEVGFFDEDLPAGEDYDLWLRISCRYPIHLIDEELVVKEGGHEDQLSRCVASLDRFRIRAIVKLIKSGILTVDQTRAALEELSIKCRIYGKGCIKRGRLEEGYFYLALPQKLTGSGNASLKGDMPLLWE